LEESAVPLVAELTERVQPVTLVTIGFKPSLSSYVSKSAFFTSPSSEKVSLSVLSSEEEEEEDEESFEQDANATVVEVAIISDIKIASKFFLRE